jgi:hypothetical protein
MSTVGNGITRASVTGPASGYNLVLSHLFIMFFLFLYKLSANTSNPYTTIILLIFTHSMICFIIFGIKICRMMPKILTILTHDVHYMSHLARNGKCMRSGIFRMRTSSGRMAHITGPRIYGTTGWENYKLDRLLRQCAVPVLARLLLPLPSLHYMAADPVQASFRASKQIEGGEIKTATNNPIQYGEMRFLHPSIAHLASHVFM